MLDADNESSEIVSLSLLTGLRNLSINDLVFCNIYSLFKSNLSPIFFAHLSRHLSRLEIFDCDFKHVPHDAFNSLVNLRVLNITKCLNCSHLHLHKLPRLERLRIHMEPPNGFRLSHGGLAPNVRFLSIIGLPLSSCHFSSLGFMRDFQHDKLLALEIDTFLVK